MRTGSRGGSLLILAASAGGVQGQTFPYDHVHMAATDQVKAANWYIKNLGGQSYDRPNHIIFGGKAPSSRSFRQMRPTRATAA